MAREKSSGNFLVGFVVGAFVGAVLALLFAPAPGEEIRNQLREKSIELKDRASDLTAKGQSFLEEQKIRFQEAIEEGKRAAARKKEELLAQLESAKSGKAAESAEEEA